jgi:KUP system potassium uptake protein
MMTEKAEASRGHLAALTLAALGVVYGDIGTSPLYAFKEAFAYGLPADESNVLATLSAFFWAMMLIVSIKYVGVMLRFDNEHEGGVLALTALAHRVARGSPRLLMVVLNAGVFAAALFYGDAIITPAISVLSAVEGISVATPEFEHMVVPITIGILVGLFLIQHHGTARVGGRIFGPVTVIWFLTLAVLGAVSIAANPVVVQALNPLHATRFAVAHPGAFFVLLGAVFLALTGSEALYADMGHFGKGPIRIAWFGLVWPSLLLNYFGQGALVLRDPSAVANPFYLLAPGWFLVPLVVLATAATVIASQAVISGAYSMTLQASRLGYLPRLRILHTSDTERGQIYIPSVNTFMLVAVVLLVLQFRSANALAAAYGIAVSGTMIITTLLTFAVTLALPGRRRAPLRVALMVFGLSELLFLSANLTKLESGGWVPLALGLFIFMLLSTWKEGSRYVAAQRSELDIPMGDFLRHPPEDVPRVAGTAVYLTSDPKLVPSALFHNLKHYKVLHERNLFLHVRTEEVPRVAPDRRAHVEPLGPGMYGVVLHFGFREEPDVWRALEKLSGIELELMTTTFFVAHASVVDGPGRLPRWRAHLFSWMTRQSDTPAGYFRLPPNRVVELGTQVIL